MSPSRRRPLEESLCSVVCCFEVSLSGALKRCDVTSCSIYSMWKRSTGKGERPKKNCGGDRIVLFVMVEVVGGGLASDLQGTSIDSGAASNSAGSVLLTFVRCVSCSCNCCVE